MPARYLEIFTPAGMERFFEEWAALHREPSGGLVSTEQAQAVWQKHGMTLLDAHS